jgi:hypothetical protein
VNWLFKKGEKKIVAHDIQGRVNEFSKGLARELKGFDPVGISIVWIDDGQTPQAFLKANKLIIRMRHHVDQDKNFVYAAMAFVQSALLVKVKKYLAPTQTKSIDIFIGRKLLEKEKPHIVDRFFDDYFAPGALTSDKIIELRPSSRAAGAEVLR